MKEGFCLVCGVWRKGGIYIGVRGRWSGTKYVIVIEIGPNFSIFFKLFL